MAPDNLLSDAYTEREDTERFSTLFWQLTAAYPDSYRQLCALLRDDIYRRPPVDRKSTRLNSSHANISYAVFCLKKKKKK